jgi:hypothetical protein
MMTPSQERALREINDGPPRRRLGLIVASAGGLAFVLSALAMTVDAAPGGPLPEAEVTMAERGSPAVDEVRELRARSGARIPAESRPLSFKEMQTLLAATAWPAAVRSEALAVSGCESSWHPAATGGHGEIGLFQIHPVHAWRFTEQFGAAADPSDPHQNAAVARQLWGEEGWAPWSCAP